MGIKIVRTRNKKFRVKYYAKNGEMLSFSEVLETKANAKKNIAAMEKLMSNYLVLIQK